MIGACVAVWGEQVDEMNLELRLWPKASSFAEALWKFDENRLPDNIVNARYKIVFAREDLLRLGIHAAPVIPADVFRNSPWGGLNSSTSLMYDINQKKQQIPEGFSFQYKRYHDYKTFCQNPPINPFCGGVISDTMDCKGDGDPYIQQACE